MTYEYKFAYVGATSSIQELLDDGWEPIPDVHPVQHYGTMASPSTHVFLRREKTLRPRR